MLIRKPIQAIQILVLASWTGRGGRGAGVGHRWQQVYGIDTCTYITVPTLPKPRSQPYPCLPTLHRRAMESQCDGGSERAGDSAWVREQQANLPSSIYKYELGEANFQVRDPSQRTLQPLAQSSRCYAPPNAHCDRSRLLAGERPLPAV